MKIQVAALAFAAVLLSGNIAQAWTGPTGTPPANNVPPPINVGTVSQTKNGNIGVNGLAVFGNSLLGGSDNSNAYLNWGAIAGVNGYGIRDSAGTLEFKNNGGLWASLNTIIQNYLALNGYSSGGGGASQWTTSGNDIYNANTGNVGIKTATPSQPLSVAGVIYSSSGGIEFPDKTIQTTAAAHNFGGSYSTAWPIAYGCASPSGGTPITGNPLTGYAESCPAGFSSYLGFQADNANGTRTCLWMCYR